MFDMYFRFNLAAESFVLFAFLETFVISSSPSFADM